MPNGQGIHILKIFLVDTNTIKNLTITGNKWDLNIKLQFNNNINKQQKNKMIQHHTYTPAVLRWTYTKYISLSQTITLFRFGKISAGEL